MISLDKLRKQSSLLIAVVGIALLAFLLGDLMNSGSSLFGNAQGVIGEVNDAIIDYRDFESEAQNLDRIFTGNQDRNQLRDNLWNDKVNEVIMGQEYQDLGIAISPEELAALSFGYKSGKMSPTAKQFFGMNTQEISTSQLASLIQQIHDNDPLRWMYFENVIRKERQAQKYYSLVKQGLMASNTDAEMYYRDQGTQVTGSYLFKAFDPNIALSDEEVKSFYKQNIDEYPRESSREISIAIFDISPTQEDKSIIKKRLTEYIDDRKIFNKKTKKSETQVGFKNTKDVESFVEAFSEESFDPTYYAEGQLSPQIETIMRNEKIGFVFGPYEENNTYRLARLNDRRNDSIQVAIISASIEASEETSNEIYAKASELALAKNKEEFDLIGEEKNVPITSVNVKEEDRSFLGVDEARHLVFWAYNESTKINSVKLDDQNNRILVLMLTDIVEEGYQELEEVSFQVESVLKKEKSGQILVEEFKTALSKVNSINDLEKQMGLVQEKVTTMSFSSNTIPGGFEPNVVGAFYGVEKGKMSKPIIGNSGVYVVSPLEFKQSETLKDYTSLKKQLEAQLQPRVNIEVFNALKELSKIEDNRVKFY